MGGEGEGLGVVSAMGVGWGYHDVGMGCGEQYLGQHEEQ